jgi:hypothetical protein
MPSTATAVVQTATVGLSVMAVSNSDDAFAKACALRGIGLEIDRRCGSIQSVCAFWTKALRQQAHPTSSREEKRLAI